MSLRRSVAVLLSVCLTVDICGAMIEPVVLVHGGAGVVSEDRFPGKIHGTTLAARIGYQVLTSNGSVLDAVEQAVRSMELDSYFNAGYGSVLNIAGDVVMEASIMDGATLKTGCVTSVKDLLHPISLARRVMEKTIHNFLEGEGLQSFAKAQGFQYLSPPGQLVTQYAKDTLEAWKEDHGYKSEIGEGGTVGAVAIDQDGNIAVATSTGGTTGKLVGRIGDTPIVGSGTYADNRWAGISATGEGDVIMKVCLTYDIVKRMEYTGVDLQTASDDALAAMNARLGGSAGVIGIDAAGNLGIAFNSPQMSWAYQKGDIIRYGINKGDSFEMKPSQLDELETPPEVKFNVGQL